MVLLERMGGVKMTFDDVVQLKGLVEYKDYPYETLREIWNEAVKSCSEFVGDNYGWPNVDGKPYAYYADNLGEEMLKKMSSNGPHEMRPD